MSPSDRTALSVRGLTVRFGSFAAVDDVAFEVGRGQLVGLIGPNGAGKTTAVDAITGFVGATGSIEFDGLDVTGLPPPRRVRLGMARTWQAVDLFADLTVRRNLEVAAGILSFASFAGGLLRGRRRGDGEGVEPALDALELGDLADAFPSELSHGQRKLVGVARALATGPTLILLDEPAAGLDEHETSDFARRLRRLVDGGLTAVLIDHDVGLIRRVCDQLCVLDGGRLLAAGPPGEVLAHADVAAAYLGDGHRAVATGGGS